MHRKRERERERLQCADVHAARGYGNSTGRAVRNGLTCARPGDDQKK